MRNFNPVIIVVNTRLLLHNRLDGIGRFTAETLKRITPSHPEVNFVFLFDGPVHDEFIFSENITPVKLFPPARRPFLYSIWLDHSVHGVLKDLQPDLFLSPDGFLPLKGNTPMLPVIHDLNFEHYPADLPSNYSKWYRKRFPLFAQKGKRIVTVSEFSKQDIAKRYNVSAEKIDVVPNAAAEGFIPLNEPEQLEVRKKYCDGAPYFLYIGALHPRKNIERLISAFGWFKARNSSPVKLVIAGGSYWKTESISNALASVPNKEDVVFTGRVTEEEVRRLAASAFAMTYVPYFEGFGIPLVESMACGVPMITSNVTSMPEVAGDAALYCDPFSVESIGTAMQQLYNDPMLHEKLKKAGQDRISLYSWDNSAKLLWDCITKTLGT